MKIQPALLLLLRGERASGAERDGRINLRVAPEAVVRHAQKNRVGGPNA